MAKQHPSELSGRAVRLVAEHRGENETEYTAIAQSPPNSKSPCPWHRHARDTAPADPQGRGRSRAAARIYRTSTDSAAPAEATFHRLLDAADHSRTIGRSAGREWFLTHTKFLDEIARTVSLHIDVINAAEFDDN